MRLLTFNTLDFIFMVVLFNTAIVLMYDNETDSLEIITKRIE